MILEMKATTIDEWTNLVTPTSRSLHALIAMLIWRNLTAIYSFCKVGILAEFYHCMAFHCYIYFCWTHHFSHLTVGPKFCAGLVRWLDYQGNNYYARKIAKWYNKCYQIRWVLLYIHHSWQNHYHSHRLPQISLWYPCGV